VGTKAKNPVPAQDMRSPRFAEIIYNGFWFSLAGANFQK